MALTWVEKGNIKGQKGEAGEPGPKGDTGYAYRSANIPLTGGASVPLTNIAPSDKIQAGDTLVDSNGNLWPVASVTEGSSVTVGSMFIGSVRGPQGEAGTPGPKGEDGVGVNIRGSVASSTNLPGVGEMGDAYITTDTGNLWVWDVETEKFVDTGAQVKGPKGDTGPKGDPGSSATIMVGSTTTGEAGTDASVTNTGTTSAAVLSFTIPRGEKGDTGTPGPGISVGRGVPSDPGQLGECYVDVSTGNLYKYEEVEV